MNQLMNFRHEGVGGKWMEECLGRHLQDWLMMDSSVLYVLVDLFFNTDGFKEHQTSEVDEDLRKCLSEKGKLHVARDG